MRRQCWAVVVLAVGALTAPASGQVQLQWEFKEGDTFYVETSTSMKQVTKLLDKQEVKHELKQTIEQTAVVSFTVKKKNDDKSVVLEEKIESVKFKTEVPGLVPTGPLPDRLQGATFQITLDARGEVTKLEGYDDVVKKLAGDDAALRKTIELVLSHAALKKTAGELFAFLPDKPVAKGAAWKRSLDVPLGPLGSLAVTGNYTYAGKDTVADKSFDKITFTASAEYKAPTTATAGVVFEVTKAELKAEDFHGTIFFDAAAGRLVQSETKMRLKGPVSFTFMGTKTDAVMEQEQTIKMRVLDKNPVVK